jgi:RNA polymerase sigma-70 factor, ECF subfamily
MEIVDNIDFEQSVLKQRDFLLSYSRNHLTSSLDESEDMVQETLLSAYRHRSAYRATGTLREWLLCILRNKYITVYRKQRRIPQALMSSFSETPSLPVLQSAGAEALAFKQLECDAIREAIHSLPQEYREVIQMSDMEGLSYQEISKQLHIPLGTVRSRLSRARSLIRRSLYVWRPELQGTSKQSYTGSKPSGHEKRVGKGA